MDDHRLVFVVGCPRSGTTWLQLLLAQHRSVTTMEETHLFSEYVGPLIRRWQRDRSAERRIGLGVTLTEEDFLRLCGAFAEGVLTRALDAKPAATVILEKTPGHVFHAADILRLFPDAMFIHVIRDPRAVVASMMNASRSWAGGWASRRPEHGAEQWVQSVRAGRRLGELTERYTEVQYRALKRAPLPELTRLFAWIGIDASEEECEAAIRACTADALKRGGDGTWSPTGMRQNLGDAVRKGEIEGWRAELTPADIAVVEHVAGEMMEACGYQRVAPRRRPPLGYFVRRVRERLRRALTTRATQRM